MMMMTPEELLAQILPKKGTLDYRVYITKFKGEEGRWLVLAVRLPSEDEEDAEEE